MTLYGPHCEHEECGWGECSYDEPAVKWACKEQATCGLCGPTSENWRRIAADWIAWAEAQYDTADPAELRAMRLPPVLPGEPDRPMHPNVIATAELIAAHKARGATA